MRCTEADQKTNTLLFAIGQAASIGASIAADNKHERNQLQEDREESYYWCRVNQQEKEFEQMGLRDQRKVWEIDALRKTDLYPNEYIRGYLFFKNEPDARGYMIRFKIKEKVFKVFFRQQVYEIE